MHYRNLSQMHRLQAERLGPCVAVRFKKHGLYRDLDWARYREMVEACAIALIGAGVEPGDRVGLLSENRVEWLIADLAILAVGAVNVPPHAPLTAPQVQYQLADAGACWLFASTSAQVEKVRAIRRQLPNLQGMVAFDVADADDALSFQGFLQWGRLHRDEHLAELRRREEVLGLDDLATVMYTSGTTGNPKGVMLSHGNLLSNIVALDEATPRRDCIILTWLPFSHIFARAVDFYLGIYAGATLCLAESAESVVENLGEIEPTHLASVPRFYEKVWNAAAGSKDPADCLRRIFGRRVEFLNSGGAPLPLEIAEAYRNAGLLLLQGYGLTETSPVITFNRKENFKLDSVGPALPGVEMRIADDGEILSRGPHIMKGYWNNPEATADTIRDGWLHTGDLGRIDDDGFLFITGRKKELVVLSNGKKVSPNFVEGLLLADPCIDQVVLCGERRSYLSALVVPHWNNFREAWVQSGRDWPAGDAAIWSRDSAFLQAMLVRVQERLAEVSPWEQIKKIVLLAQPFSVVREELTVSLKLRRNVIQERHQAAIDALYEAG